MRAAVVVVVMADCVGDSFHCDNKYECANASSRCNLIYDCSDGSDERNCRMYTFIVLCSFCFPFLSTHADRQGVDISFTVFIFVVCVCVCLFVRLRISPPRIKLPASNFARRFLDDQGKESNILGNCSPRSP